MFHTARSLPAADASGPADPGLVVEQLRSGAWEILAAPAVPVEIGTWRLHRRQIDCPGGAGRPLELRFRAAADAAAGAPVMGIASPVLTRPGRRRPPPSVVLIVVDSLRADHGGLSPDDPADLPGMAALRGRGLVFEQARTASSWTRASMASMLTGASPWCHGMETENPGLLLPPEPPTLAQRLRERGYRSTLVTGNPHLDPAFGISRGYDLVVSPVRRGEDLTARLLEELRAEPAAPLFLTAFYVDAHAPWPDRAEYSDAQALAGVTTVDVTQLGTPAGRRRQRLPDPDEAQRDKLRALYRENLRHVDAQLVNLLAGLAADSRLADSVVVLTADHGEAFGDHGYYFHGWTLLEELLHVPLVIAAPGIPGPGRTGVPVSLQLLPEMVLAAIDGDNPDALARSRAQVPQAAGTRFRNTTLDAWIRWPWKLILHPPSGSVELYDLVQDPGERVNRAVEEPERAARMRAALEAHVERERAGCAAPGEGPAPGRSPATGPSAEALRQLEALGYLAGGESTH